MAKMLIEWETLESEQIDDIMEGREPTPPSSEFDQSSSVDDSKPSGGQRRKPVVKPRMDRPASGEA